jgi:hypothetical protein
MDLIDKPLPPAYAYAFAIMRAAKFHKVRDGMSGARQPIPLKTIKDCAEILGIDLDEEILDAIDYGETYLLNQDAVEAKNQRDLMAMR